MSCKQTDKIGLYLGRRLAEGEIAGFEAHLKACPRCAAEVKAFQSLKETYRRKTEALPQIDLVAGVMSRINRAGYQPGRMRLAAAPAPKRAKKRPRK